VGNASRKKKTSASNDQAARANREKKLAPLRESPSRVSPQNTPSIIKNVPIFILLLVSFAVYLNALFGAFVYDDMLQIVKNPWIRDIRNIPVIFSKSVWSFLPGRDVDNYYRPLMHIVYMLNYYLFGLNPWGFHLVNILFHCGATVLVFLLIRRFLTEQGVTTSLVYLSPAFIAAVLFAVHPIHTEAVTWIAGLPDVSFTFFYLLSFYCYVRSKTVLSGSYFFSLVCFAVAALFKEPALTLPVILLAYDYVYREERLRLTDYVKRYISYLVIAAGYLVLRIHILGGFAPLKIHVTMSSYQYAINVFPLFSQYLEKLLVPLNLNAFYVFHPITSLFQLKGILSLMVTAVIVALIAIAFKRNRIAFLGLLFVTVPLMPVLYIPALGVDTFTDRYLYLPSVGYVFLVGVFLSWAKEKLPRAVTIIMIVAVVIGGLYAVGTVTRNNVWRDNFSLWSDTVKKSSDSAFVHYNLGNTYESQGQMDKAIAEYKTALQLKPDYEKAHYNLGTAYASRGLWAKAIPEFETALWLKPDLAATHTNLGVAYQSQGQLDYAILEYQTALRLNPDDVDAHNNLGVVYRSQGLLNKAIAEFQTAIRLRPDYESAHRNLGVVYESQGQLDYAIAEYQTALRLRPDDFKARQHVNDLVSKRH
jgi:tetratricopeptide (TPR) repeat protein